MIDKTLVQNLIRAQFPKWKDLPIKPIAKSGSDNKTFHLGTEMLVRLPSAADYAQQVEKEQKWLPILAPLLPLSIPEPIAMGKPSEKFPWKWSIYKYLEGQTAASTHIPNMNEFARTLAQFLTVLEDIKVKDLPKPGPHNFYRGGELATYDKETREAISILKDQINAHLATEVWETALTTSWKNPPVPIHGDLSAGNLLMNEGRLSAVIDFGMLGEGDPACDLAIAWTLLDTDSRKIFKETLSLDKDTWARGRAWVLWKSLIVAAGLIHTNSVETKYAWPSIDATLADYKKEL